MRTRAMLIQWALALAAAGAALGAEPAATPPPGRPQVALAGNWQRQLVARADDGDQPGDKWESIALPKADAFARDMNGLWYERIITIPADWQGRRVALHIGHCLYGMVVYCNDTKAGEIPGYGGDADLTTLVKFGQSNTVRLFSGRLGKGLSHLDKVSQCIAEYYSSGVTRGGNEFSRKAIGIICPAEEFYVEARSPQVFVDDVWYQTFTRGMQRIEPVLTIQCGQPIEGLTAKVLIYDPATGAAVKEKNFALQPLPAGCSRQRLVLPAAELKRWALHEPNLYLGQVVLTDAKGVELDRTVPTSFGLREFWAQGRIWYMNNGPVYFVCAGYSSDAAAVDGMMKVGVTLFSHGVPYWGRFLNEDMVESAEKLDRKGAGFCPTGVSMSQLNMNDPEVLRDYAVWAKAHARRLENHPSVLIYGLGYNTPGSSPDFIPPKVGRTDCIDWPNAATTLAYQYSQRADPTRVYYYYGGPRAPATWSGNFYPNHTPIQEIEEWFSAWFQSGDLPIITFESTTSTMGSVDYEKNGVPLATEYAAIQAGDAAYAQEREDYLSYSTHIRNRQTFWDFNITQTAPLVFEQTDMARVRITRAWRYWGLPFWNWDYWNKTLLLDDGLRRPSLAWIAGPAADWPAKDHNFYAGDTISKSVMVLRDLTGDAPWKIAWQAKLEGAEKPFADGNVDQPVGAYARLKVPFSFTAPAVTAPTPATISLTVKDAAGGPIATDEFALTIFPQPAAAVSDSETFTVFDPAGETTSWLKERGAQVQPYNPAADRKPSVLILGRGALQGLKTLPFTAEQVADGLRVVVFEQHCNDLGNLGFQHEDCCPRQAFVRQPENPLAAGLTPDGLRDWQGSGTLISSGPAGDRTPISTRLAHWGNQGNVASDIIETPHFGSFLPVLDCEFDLAYSPLLSWRHGAGEVLFCQCDLTGRVGHEPEATLLADNLIRYLNKPLKLRQTKQVACLDEATAHQVEALGFAAEVMGPKFTKVRGFKPANRIVVLTGAQSEALAAHREQLADFADAGGDVLVLYASEKFVADPAFEGKLKLGPARMTRAGTTVDANPLLTGVGPQNIHWREPVIFQKIESSDSGFVSLLGGLLGILPQGKGRFIFFQVDPAAMKDLTAVKQDDAAVVADLTAQKSPLAKKTLPDSWFLLDRMHSRWQVNELHSLLLTNLGVDSSAPLVERLFKISRPIPFTPVNAWVVLGPIPPADMINSDKAGNPLGRPDLTGFSTHRDMAWRMTSARGDTLHWIVPTDSQNGMGLDGKVDLAKIWGVRVRDLGVAVTYLWSTRERDATLGLGADWWLRVDLNGAQVFESDKNGYGVNFDQKLPVHLKAGWNEVVCYLGAGSNGHMFWFEITNPGDVVVAQQLTAPTAPPEGIPPAADLLPDKVEPGFALYTETITAPDDPYGYIPW